METLKNSKEFNSIYSKGRKIYTKYTILFVAKDQNQKFGFVCSKKVGNAVIRNRLKRIFREIVRKNISKFNTNYSFVIVAKKNCKDDFESLGYKTLYKDIMLGIKKNEKNSVKPN